MSEIGVVDPFTMEQILDEVRQLRASNRNLAARLASQNALIRAERRVGGAEVQIGQLGADLASGSSGTVTLFDADWVATSQTLDNVWNRSGVTFGNGTILEIKTYLGRLYGLPATMAICPPSVNNNP